MLKKIIFILILFSISFNILSLCSNHIELIHNTSHKKHLIISHKNVHNHSDNIFQCEKSSTKKIVCNNCIDQDIVYEENDIQLDFNEHIYENIFSLNISKNLSENNSVYHLLDILKINLIQINEAINSTRLIC